MFPLHFVKNTKFQIKKSIVFAIISKFNDFLGTSKSNIIRIKFVEAHFHCQW